MPANPAKATPQRTPPGVANRKRPGDFTGVSKEKLVQQNQEEIALAAEAMTMADTAKAVANEEVVDYTELPKIEPLPVKEVVPVKPVKWKIRVIAPIEQMTFNRQVIDEGDFSDPQNPRMPTLGGLLYYDFEEGREYIVNQDMKDHLDELGYLYDAKPVG